MIDIIINEWTKFLRNSVFVYLNVFFIFSLIFVVYLGILQNNSQETNRKIVEDEVREQWDNLNL